MLRGFNAPGGIAHTSADSVAERTKAAATTLTPGEAVTRFTECAEILRATTMSNEAVISCPVLGSTTSAVIADVALMEVTVHLLDLLVDVPDPTAAIEVLAGRAIQRSLCRRSGDDRPPLTAN